MFYLFILLHLLISQSKYLSLTCHLIACQVLIVRSDLIDQLAVHDFHNTVSSRLHDLMVTGGKDQHTLELHQTVV